MGGWETQTLEPNHLCTRPEILKEEESRKEIGTPGDQVLYNAMQKRIADL